MKEKVNSINIPTNMKKCHIIVEEHALFLIEN